MNSSKQRMADNPQDAVQPFEGELAAQRTILEGVTAGEQLDNAKFDAMYLLTHYIQARDTLSILNQLQEVGDAVGVRFPDGRMYRVELEESDNA